MELLESVSLKVELFAGTNITDAASDLCQLAGRVGILCESVFNDVILWARPGDDPEKIIESYHEQCGYPSRMCRIAQHRRL